jgi:glutaminase
MQSSHEVAMNVRGRQDRHSAITACLEELHAKYQHENGGALADYIPELTKVDPSLFGIALMTVDGQPYSVGDCQVPFTIQSISKAFVYGLALEDHGLEGVLARVGVEPSGDAFNAIVFDERTNRPFNPMVNAGAIATTGLIKGHGSGERMARIVEMFRRYTGRVLDVDEAVFTSESATGHRNRAITWLMLNFGMVDARVDEHLEVYFRQCSLLVTAEDLAMMAATLANGGINPVTGERALDARYVKYVMAVMASCGMYDFAGEWSFRVGLPAKSGVGGGIVAALPGQMGVGTFSPLLDDRGNSLRGIKACDELSRRFGLHVFDPVRSADAVVRTYHADRVRSKVMRRATERRVLDEFGHRVVIMEIQGDLQFRAGEQILRRADAAMHDRVEGCDHLILDLHRVGRVAPAAADLLHQLNRNLASVGTRLYCAAAGGNTQNLFSVGLPRAAFHATLDSALEHCEAALLAQHLVPDGCLSPHVPMAEMELLQGLSEDDLERLSTRVSSRHFPAGSTIIHQGEDATFLCFLARGRVAIQIPDPANGAMRLTSIGPGVAFGEMALVDGGLRSADAVAEEDCDVLQLDLPTLQTLSWERPGIVNTLMTNITKILSGRLRRANAELQTLTR